MPRRPPSLLFFVFMFVAGALGGYCVLRMQGWSMPMEVIPIWEHMIPPYRLAMIACLSANASGLGGILNWLLRRRR